MKKTIVKSALLAVVGACLVAGNAVAEPFFGDGGAALQTAVNGMTVTPAGSSSTNFATDMLADSSDSYWEINATGGSVATVMLETAGFADDNIFGVYASNDPTQRIILFEGVDGPGAQATLSIKDDGQVTVSKTTLVNGEWVGSFTSFDFGFTSFGYFLDTPGEGGIFFSDTSLNGDGLDHMAAYQGQGDMLKLPNVTAGLWSSNEYILAWEDLAGGGDKDYDDFIVMVESVSPAPVPEPATMLLFGTGIAGLTGMVRRRRMRNKQNSTL